MPLSEQDKQKLDAVVAKMEASGESEDSIRTLVEDYKTRYGSMQGTAERLGEGVGRQLKGAVTGAYDAVMNPKDTYNGLVQQSADNFGEAGKLAGEGEYGHALMHGISGILPPFAAVTDAGDRWRKGDVSGAMGDAIGMGLLPHIASAVPSVARGVAKGVPKVIGAVARATPDGALPVLGAGIGAYTDGPRGFFEGAFGGSALDRAMPRLRKLGMPKEGAPEAPSSPVGPKSPQAGGKVAPKSPKPPTGAPKPSTTPKSDKVKPMTREEEYAQELFNQRMDDTHGADNPIPGNSGPQKSTAPPISTRMDMEPDFLKQDVVRYPRPKGIIRSDESTLGLAKEINPNVKGLNSYPRPVGSSEQARALRQRANIAEGTPSPKKVAPKKPSTPKKAKKP